LIFATIAGALELGARLDDWWRFEVPMSSGASSADALWVVDSLGGHGRASAHYQKWQMNALGLRGPEVPVHPEPGRCRVITVGASETFGLYESPGEEWPAQLARLAGSRVEVLNAALPGMSLPTVTQDVRRRLAGYRPNVVVLYPSPAQYLGREAPSAVRPRSSLGAHAGAGVLATVRVASRVRDQVKGMIPSVILDELRRRDVERQRSRDGGALTDAAIAARGRAFEEDVRGFVGDVRTAGAQPLLVVHAHAGNDHPAPSSNLLLAWQRQVPLAEIRNLIAFEAATAAAVIRVAADSNVAFGDPRAALARGSDYWADAVHFSDRGAAVIATEVRRLLALPTACDA